MHQKNIVFLGRNTDNIIEDCKKVGININTIIKRDDDNIQYLNKKYELINVSDFKVEEDTNYIVVCNGGTTEQQVPVISKLATKNNGHIFLIIEKDLSVKVYSDYFGIFILDKNYKVG